MKIEIISTESLGTRGLCCLVTMPGRTVLIDPGIALGYIRQGLFPHPFQVFHGVIVRRRIIAALSQATDVVFSHFHGDHIPLANANPFQLSLQSVKDLLIKPNIWVSGCEELTATMQLRRTAICEAVGKDLSSAEGRVDNELSFSRTMPHGSYAHRPAEVMMTRIEANGRVFVHADDIQLLEYYPVQQIIDWRPDVVLVSGPPIYLERLGKHVLENARKNALHLADCVDTLIIDHHLMRSHEGVLWLENVCEEAGGNIMCAADYMEKPRFLLEAWRRDLYRELPVPHGWHNAYAEGTAQIEPYLRWRDRDLSNEYFE